MACSDPSSPLIVLLSPPPFCLNLHRVDYSAGIAAGAHVGGFQQRRREHRWQRTNASAGWAGDWRRGDRPCNVELALLRSGEASASDGEGLEVSGDCLLMRPKNVENRGLPHGSCYLYFFENYFGKLFWAPCN